jgi:hypothetical protein
MDVGQPFSELNPVILVAGCILPVIATPIGLVVAFLVRRFMPVVNVLMAAILAGYIVSVVILFTLIYRALPDSSFNLYGAALISLVLAAGIIVALVYIIQRRLFAQAAQLQAKVKEEHVFSVGGEDVRDKRKNLRRKP